MFKHKKWILFVMLLPLVFLFLKVGIAEIKAIANYFLIKDVVDIGGASSQSTTYVLIDAIGQPGGVGVSAGTSYKESSGFFVGEKGANDPLLSVSPTILDFGTTETIQSFQINNSGGGTLSWTVTKNPDKPWITTISPTSGSNDTTVAVTVDRSLLTENSDTATITVSSNGGNGNVFVSIGSSLIVWPGDTNNDGITNQTDILPLGLFWASTGPARSDASMNWTGQPVSPWSPPNATFADGTGDGKVNQVDVLPIGLNWGQTHGLLTALSEENHSAVQSRRRINQTLRINLSGSTKPNEVCLVEIVAENVIDLFGISFVMIYSPTSYIDSVQVGESSWLGDDIIFYPVVDKTAGKISFGLSRKAGQGSISGTGVVASIQMKMKDIPFIETALTLENVTAIDHMGTSINFDVVNATITAVEEAASKIIPQTFELQQNYPNPFNPNTEIRFALPRPEYVYLSIYNLVGQELRTLVSEYKDAGRYQVTWDAKDNNGSLLTTGVYVYQLRAGDFIGTKKLLLVK